MPAAVQDHRKWSGSSHPAEATWFQQCQAVQLSPAVMSVARRRHKSLSTPHEPCHCLSGSVLYLCHAWQHVFPQLLRRWCVWAKTWGLLEKWCMLDWRQRGCVLKLNGSPETASVHPPARQQYATHSAVIQSLALAHQMVSPVLRLTHSLAPLESRGFGMICKQT